MSPAPEIYAWVSLAAIAWGLIDVFFGYRLFRITLAVIGGLSGVLAGYFLAQSLALGTAGSIAVVVVSGIIGAGLAFLLYLAGVFIAGFGFGATLMILLLASFNPMVAMISGCVAGIIGGFAAVKLQSVLIILSTSLLGAFRVIFALSYFTSHLDWAWYYQNPQHIPVLIDNNPWMFPSILALAVIGTVAQFLLRTAQRKKDKTKDD